MKSLLNLILERLDYERLINEGKDPVEALHAKYDNTIPSEVIDKVISIDPTKKKSYSQWLLSHWDDQHDIILDNLNNGRIEKLFQYFHTRNDIQLKALTSVEKVLDSYVPHEDTVLSKERGEFTYVKNLDKKVPSELANDFDILFDQDNWIIATPNTYEASCKLGENMTWCTANAYGNGEYHYKNYLGRGGKYYINFDMSHGETKDGKDYPYTRYQFHFETRQFMDSHNHPVKLDEIGMPESAIEYYDSIGYDIYNYLNNNDDDDDEYEDDDEELNNEIEQQQYEEWRNQYKYDLGDGLYLNIEYDFDYNRENVNENTRFYLYDGYDDIDAITGEDMPNPHVHNDVVIYNSEHALIMILRIRGVDDKVLIINGDGHGYRRVGTDVILKDYFILPDETGLIGIHSNGDMLFYTDSNTEQVEWFRVNEFPSMFVNEPFSELDKNAEYDMYVEAVVGKYHALFGISGEDIYTLIRKDIPQNGERFEMDENGVVTGFFGKHRILEMDDLEDYSEENGFYSFDFEEELENGCYLVSTTIIPSTYGHSKYRGYNIFDPRTKKLVLEKWYENFLGIKCGAYIFHSRDGAFVLSKNGKSLGSYQRITELDNRGFLIGSKDREMLINTQKEDIIGVFSRVFTKHPVNNKIAVIHTDGFTTYFFDYIEEKICFSELGHPWPLSYSSSYEHLFIMREEATYGTGDEATDSKSLFDLSKEAIVLKGFTKLKHAYRRVSSQGVSVAENGMIIATKTDGGKVNLFDTRTSAEVLPYDVDKIRNTIDVFKLVEYELNGKAFIYSYRLNRILTNPNGFGSGISINYIFPNDDIQRVNITASNMFAEVIFSYRESGEFEFTGWIDKTSHNKHGNIHTLGDSINAMTLYCNMTGQQPSSNPLPTQQEEPANAFTEEIKRFMDRIDEISNIRWHDIID